MPDLSNALIADIEHAARSRQLSMFGHVSRFDGQMIECGGFPANIGSLCHVETDDDEPAIAELIGFNHGNNPWLKPISSAMAGSSSSVST